MNKSIENKNIEEKDIKGGEREKVSLDDASQRTVWYIASELAGLPQMPTSARRARDELERLLNGREHLKRKRAGTKGFEYHISILPHETQIRLNDGHECEFEEPEIPKISYDLYRDFTEEFALIPGYRVQVSAGHGSLTPEHMQPTRHLAFRRKWLKYRGFSEKDLVIVWAKGDSMEPTINNNDTLVVHMGRKVPKDGHIYIFRNGDDLFVKRYQNVLGAWRLISDNNRYDNVDIPKQEQHQFEVVGQVVHIAKDIGD
ncbi:S24 family peptidase [Vibrio fluvialis]|uniref:helix-turn-helix domain-containing protein n=1 Tax=Vibrio fluvialis TaxID=676 RepID=UPI001F192B5A|nr:S24 family peptidase [Vibrio fluvialis]MCE7638351.1 S24 family peptidase [Vibrio fluvialis]